MNKTTKVTGFLFVKNFTGHEYLEEFSPINMFNEDFGFVRENETKPLAELIPITIEMSVSENGRVYDQTLGRFLSPDNYIQNPEQVQSYNRYSYALNNPLKYVDPSGQRISVADYHANYLHMSYSQYAEEQGSSGGGSRGGGSIGSGSGNGYSGRTTESSKTTWIQLGFFYYDENGNPVTINGVNGEFWIYEAYVFDNNRSFGVDRNDFSAGNGNMWHVATNSGGSDWTDRAGYSLTGSGLAFNALQNTVTSGDMWLGNNGKYYSNTWGGNQYTGSRAGAFKAAGMYKMAGRANVAATALSPSFATRG